MESTSTAAASLPSPFSLQPSSDDAPMAFAVEFGSTASSLDMLVTNNAQRPLVRLSQCYQGQSICGTDSEPFYKPNDSSTWHSRGSSRALYEEQLVGYFADGSEGSDSIRLLGQDKDTAFTIDSQAIDTSRSLVPGTYAINFAGVLGIRPHSDLSLEADESNRSLLYALKEASSIPSLSWGYGAAAVYTYDNRLIVQSGLTLGGYNARLLSDPDQIEIYNFNSDKTNPERDMVVTIGTLTTNLTSSPTTTLLPNPINAFIDMGTDDMWLPKEACDLFASSFRLQWNDTTERYTTSNRNDIDLVSQYIMLTFNISDYTGEAKSNRITIDLGHLTPPIITDTWTFPLRRAVNESQYTLGRSFLRSAYLIADYERRQFSIQQINRNGGQYPSLRTIEPVYPINSTTNITATASSTAAVHPSTTNTGTTSDPASSNPDHYVLRASIGGGVAGLVLVLAVIAGALFYRRRKLRKASQAPYEGKPELPVPDHTFGNTTHVEALGPMQHQPEMDGDTRRLKSELAGIPRNELYGSTAEHQLDTKPREVLELEG